MGGQKALPLLLLAAGQSSRMRGADKLMETIGGVPLIRRQAMAALDTGLAVHVALPAMDHPRHQALAGLDIMPLVLPESGEGMGGTLRAGVAALPDAPRFLILLADLPEITAADLALVTHAPAEGALIWQGAMANGTPGHPVAFDHSLRLAFAALRGDEGAKSVIKAHVGARRLVTLPDTHATRDLDTPEEWAAWRVETGIPN